jgi:hypothetical protein
MGHLLKLKCVDSRVNVLIFASTSASFTLTTVQVPNLALTHTKRIKNNYCFRLWHITDSIFQHLDAVSLLRCEKVRFFPWQGKISLNRPDFPLKWSNLPLTRQKIPEKVRFFPEMVKFTPDKAKDP